MQSKYLLVFLLVSQLVTFPSVKWIPPPQPGLSIPHGMIEGGWESLGVSGGMRDCNLAKAGRQHISVVPQLASEEAH